MTSPPVVSSVALALFQTRFKNHESELELTNAFSHGALVGDPERLEPAGNSLECAFAFSDPSWSRIGQAGRPLPPLSAGLVHHMPSKTISQVGSCKKRPPA
jgi:hypothetical protein